MTDLKNYLQLCTSSLFLKIDTSTLLHSLEEASSHFPGLCYIIQLKSPLPCLVPLQVCHLDCLSTLHPLRSCLHFQFTNPLHFLILTLSSIFFPLSFSSFISTISMFRSLFIHVLCIFPSLFLIT